MTTKQKFDCDDPDVIVLKNGRYAYRVECPWKGKNDRQLHAFKFASAKAYESYKKRKEQLNMNVLTESRRILNVEGSEQEQVDGEEQVDNEVEKENA